MAAAQIQLQRALFALKFGSQILGDRVILVLALIGNFGLFGYAVLYPDLTRLATAGLFSLTVFMPILHYGRRQTHGSTVQETDQAAA